MTSAAEYAALDAVNISTLIHILESPKAYRHALTSPRTDTPALAQGRALHCAVLEPEQWSRRYLITPYADQRSDAAKAWPDLVRQAIIQPATFKALVAVSPYADFRSKAAQEWRDATLAGGATIMRPEEYRLVVEMAERHTPETLAPSFEVLTLDQAARIQAAADEVVDHPQVMRLLSGGAAEEVWEWTDPETGIACKGRTDYVGSMGLIDLKATRSVQPRRFASQVASLGYLVKMAWYQWGLGLATGCTPPPVYLIAVQLDPYVDVACYRLSDLDLLRGRATVQSMLRTLAECRRTGRWPGAMEDRIETLELPAWAQTEEE